MVVWTSPIERLWPAYTTNWLQSWGVVESMCLLLAWRYNNVWQHAVRVYSSQTLCALRGGNWVLDAEFCLAFAVVAVLVWLWPWCCWSRPGRFASMWEAPRACI